MDGHNLVAVYGSRAEAERARDRLVEFGIPDVDIRMSATEGPIGGIREGTAAGAVPTQHREGFWDWLFGRDVPASDRGWYETNLREGRTVLSVFVRDQTQRQRIEDILEEFSPIDFDEHSGASMEPRDTAATAPAWTPGTMRTEEGLPASDVGREPRTRDDGEEVIPVVKEELAVGKRASERRYRIRAYVVETPVEREVALRDERVVVERRPVSAERGIGTAHTPQEREYEVIERHEEPVVEKRAREVEEVAVRKEANERTEIVRDNVRETKVDVDNEADPAADALERTPPAQRPR